MRRVNSKRRNQVRFKTKCLTIISPPTISHSQAKFPARSTPIIIQLRVNHRIIAQQKRDRKELKRAAKLARQQQLANQAAQAAGDESSRFAELWEAQEAVERAKYEPVEDYLQQEIIPVDPALMDIEPANTIEEPSVSVKKRKRRAQSTTEDSHLESSKKHKRPRSSGIPGDQMQNSLIESPGSSRPDINLNELAGQFYSDRKKPSSSTTVQAIAENEDIGDDTDVNFSALQDHLAQNGQPDGGNASEEEVENYRDEHIDEDYQNDSSADQAMSEDSAENHDESLVKLNVADLGPTAPIYGTAGLQQAKEGFDGVEIPSSVPRPESAGDTASGRVGTSKTNTGRKRVAKPDFFNRVIEGIDDGNEFQSPTIAAASRKKGKGKQTLLAHDPEAGPSTSNGTGRQPKISSVLQGLEDGEGLDTPSNSSVVRLRTPRTPVTVTGPFSDFELRNLSQAIERYREDTGKTQHQVNELIHGNPKDSKSTDLWERIMATCVGRSRQKVINQTRRRFHNFVARGTWTPEQERELKQMYDQYGNKYALIGQLINRHPEDIRDRIRNYLVCGDNQRKDQWNQEEQDQLIAIVQQAIELIHIQRAKQGDTSDRPVEEDINWQLVSQGMNRTRSRLQCISKWKAIKPQLVGGGLDGESAPMEEIIRKARDVATSMSYRNRFMVIKAILRTGANADSRIPWLKVRTELNMQWTRPPLMVVWFRLRRTIAGWQTLNVKEICTFLINQFSETHALAYNEEDNNDFSLEAEYREIEYKIQRGRKSHTTVKTPAIVAKTSDDEDEAIRDQLDATEEEAQSSRPSRRQQRVNSVDLGMNNVDGNELEIADSEPENEARTKARRATKKRASAAHVEEQGDDIDNSSDTNASQVESIPAR
ncbi:hypothetical protein F5Y16DRAFT_271255 [Xylariaceae sp. FL0255]|nr:hypothetical protein F5Y16DRAFT_271255 [Xylariaceae sp. FL0255]